MTEDVDQECRFFVSYSGVKLPFNLVNPIPAEGLSHRNTFVRAYFDKAGTLSGFDKVVYGEVELSHRYQYHDNGALKRAEIVMLDEEPAELIFDNPDRPRADDIIAGQDAHDRRGIT